MTKFVPTARYVPRAGYDSTTAAVLAMQKQGKTPGEIALELGTTTETVRGIIQRDRKRRRAEQGVKLAPAKIETLKRVYIASLGVIASHYGLDEDFLHDLFRKMHVHSVKSVRLKKLAQEGPPATLPMGSTPALALRSLATKAPEPLPKMIEPPEVEAPAGEAILAPTGWVEPPAALQKIDRQIDAKTEAQPETDMLQMLPAQSRADERVQTSMVMLQDLRTGNYLNLDGSGVTRNRHHAYRGKPHQAKVARLKFAPAQGMKIVPFTK